ncbi:MAG: integral rane sensor signal transduction histidine kinase [Myxococcaceae bacterium]|nr:integral rane sensor signal transduction histidine kinase [Myxococcaceae bacterium]
MTALRESPAFELRDEPDNFSLERVAWLIRLRWFALLGILVAALLAALGAFPGVRWSVLVITAALAAVYNFLLWRGHRAGASPAGGWAATIQALGDMLLLTIVLWAAGGAECPFVSYYVFHVAIVGILAGPRATEYAAITAMLGTGFLVLSSEFDVLRIGRWDPVGQWGFVAEAVAFVSTVATVAYLVTHAMRELRDRQEALMRARDNAALEYELLSNTLDQLEAGLEVLGSDGVVAWRNRRADELNRYPALPPLCPRSQRACHPVGKAQCPVEQTFETGEPGRCRFAVNVEGQEHVYEMLTFKLNAPRAGVQLMNLYVDRTQATLADERLLLAERLASLGRVAQGVAHELNTPLATIRTLASDMRASLREVAQELARESAAAPPKAAFEQLRADIDESAALVHDETLRLGRITQSLLAGGDLVRSKIEGEVSVGAMVERARALVFAGVRNGPRVVVGQGIDDLRVAADPDRMVQVLVNLLQNAYDAVRGMPHDAGITIRAEPSGEHALILIEDDGPGIAMEVRQRLFEPFATSKPQGTGLGLYISFMLARAMGGDLWLDPRPVGGTVATLRLQRAVGEPLLLPADASGSLLDGAST